MHGRLNKNYLLFHFAISVSLLGILFIGGSPYFDHIFKYFQVQGSSDNTRDDDNQSLLCTNIGIIGPTYTGPDGCPQPCPTDIQDSLPQECIQPTQNPEQEQPTQQDASSNVPENPNNIKNFEASDIITQPKDSDIITQPKDSDIITQPKDSDIITQPKDSDIITQPTISICASDITGKWNGNDGGIYFVRQIGNDIWWFGSNVFTASPEFNTFSNVLHGSRDGLSINANWQDVPLGDTRSKGEISLTIASSGDKITTKSASGGFGGNTWTKKCDNLIVKPKLPTDVILAESDPGLVPPPKGGFNEDMVDSSATEDSGIESDIRGDIVAK
jgi:hypothetical protein